ncbi:energy-coupling factor transporter transmembrane protein EcfT [Paracoccus sp. IB05]|uniref:energy-coupling factor transporter transmembrane component T family protein n=1 Tax=Paracoccus sp. IB05 TaxID=2779367 RepID=UPI0018E90A01|nr:energy-coupling factor transporter transmembrane component T [Paracoccus sp. IB05]MBJ2150204.1 energy-coupling factor transporter transmembrane protein EcfT [Paracoccus sp. IB05]
MAAAKDKDREKTLLYVPGEGWLHRLNPLTRLTGLGLVAVAAFALPPAATIVIALVATLMGTVAGAGAVFLRRLTLTLGPLALALFVVHGMLMDHPNRFGFLGLDLSHDGLMYMVKILGRIAALLSGSLVFVTTTHPSALLKALDSHGFPPGVSYLIASPLLLLEPFTQRARAIREAQMARGLDLEGSFFARIRAFPALLLPLVTLALADIDHRAQVLDGRGFRARPRRTVLDAPKDSPRQRLARRVMLGLAPLLIVGAFFWH